MMELKPCPFCGGEADFLVKDWDNRADEYKVACLQCGIQQANYSFNKDFVVKAWNRRASDEQERKADEVNPRVCEQVK